MMYKQGDDFLLDFITRTKDNYIKLQGSPYEVTQLINSSVGLLIIPEQTRFNKLKDEMISQELLKDMQKCVKLDTYSEDSSAPNLQQIAKHMRNAIAHYNLTFHNNSKNPPEIQSISFTDSNTINEQFEMEVSIELLRTFFFEFSDAASKLKIKAN